MESTYRENGPVTSAVFLHLPNEGVFFQCTGIKQFGALLQFFSYDKLIHSIVFDTENQCTSALVAVTKEIVSVLNGYHAVAVYTGDDTRMQYP